MAKLEGLRHQLDKARDELERLPEWQKSALKLEVYGTTVLTESSFAETTSAPKSHINQKLFA